MSKINLLFLTSITLLALTSSSSAFYDYKTGRWLNQDPIGYQDGPNLYAYVHSNPINRMDSFGLCADGPCVYQRVVDPREGSPEAICQELHPLDDSAYSSCVDEYYGGSKGLQGEYDGNGIWPNDTESGRCGPDVSWEMIKLRGQIDQAWDNEWGFFKREIACASIWNPVTGWDIVEFHNESLRPQFTGWGYPTKDCENTVTMYGRCYEMSNMNYWLWGYLNHKCYGNDADSLNKALLAMWAWKISYGHWPWSDEMDEVNDWFMVGWYGHLPLDINEVRSNHEHCTACRISWHTELTAKWGPYYIGGKGSYPRQEN